MTVRIEKHATLMTNGLFRRVGWKEDGRERERSCNEERRPPANEGQRERLPRTRNRPEAVLIKFREGGKWLQTYKEHMLARLCVKA